MNERSPIRTKDLLDGNIQAGANDKVYLLCTLSSTDEGYRVDLQDTDPVVWLNERFRQAFGRSDDPLVKTVQQRDPTAGQYALLSAGAFLWKEDNLVLLQRDADAPSFAGALTEAAGRCGERPSKTLVKELNEEFLVGITQQGQPIVLGISSVDFSHADVREVKLKQLADRWPASSGETRLEIIEAIPFYPDYFARNTASIYRNNRLLETIQGSHFLDAANNTLEIRQSYQLPKDLDIVSIVDGEPYNRPVVIQGPAYLHAINAYMTPTLDQAVKAYQRNHALNAKAPASLARALV